MEDEIRNALDELRARISAIENALKKEPLPKGTKTSITNLLLKLKNEEFFNEPRSAKQLLDKLAEQGYHYPSESLTAPLQRAVKRGILGRIKRGDVWTYVKR